MLTGLSVIGAQNKQRKEAGSTVMGRRSQSMFEGEINAVKI